VQISAVINNAMFVKEYIDEFLTFKSKEAGLIWMAQENRRGKDALTISFQPLACAVQRTFRDVLFFLDDAEAHIF